MKRKTPLVLTLAGLLLAAMATDILSAPRAPTQEFHTYMPLIVGSYPPSPPAYRLYADPDDLAWLAQEPYRDETIPATFTYGRSWETDIRYRGDASRLMSKKCWKVFFPGSDLFQGPRGPSQEELNLNADYPDQTLLRSYVGYDLFARVGVPTPHADFARLYMNDNYYGIFSQVEQVDKRFLHRMDIEIHGNLYKPYYGNLCSLDYISDPEEREWWYRHYYPKKTNRLGGHEDIIAFIELINHTPEAQFPQAIVEVLDVNEWLDWYAVNILIGNFEMMEKNHYLYHDLSTDRWLVLPWDLDLSLGHNMWGPGVGGLLDEELSWDNPIDSGTQESKKVDGKWNKLIDAMMNVPEFRFFHCRRLRELMAHEFSPTQMSPHIDEAFQYIHHWAELDPYRWQPQGFQFSEGPGELKTYVVNRIQFLEEEMSTFCPDMDVPLTVNEFMADNGSTVADEAGDYDDWIEIHNGSSTLSWDLGGMYLSDDPSQPTKWRIPGDTWLPPGGVLLLWADGEEGEGPLHTNFELEATGGQIALFDRDVFGNALLSARVYTAQGTDVSHGRMPDGSDVWQSFPSPTPGWHNQGHPPAIDGTAHTPASPTSSDSVTILALISDDGTALTATLRYRAFEPGTSALPLSPPRELGGSSPYDQQAPMYDDGAHGDSGPNDGIYGTTLPPQEDGTWVEYYIEAQDDAGMVAQDRPGWPQGDHRYIVGWQPPPLVINELMALNTHTLEDEEGDCDDWIEVYNTGTEAVDMSGMYFSDNVGLSTQYTVPAGTVIGPGEYRIFWADGDPPPLSPPLAGGRLHALPAASEGAGQSRFPSPLSPPQAGGRLHVPPAASEGNGHLTFKLSGAGEYVGLFDSQAGYYGPIDAVYFDPQTPDVSWGRFPDSGDTWYAMNTPTPGAPNRLAPPQFSQVARTPTWPGAGGPVTVTATITAGTSIASATLWYDTGSGFHASPLTGVDAHVYTAQIPPQTESTLVKYYMEAVDSEGQSTLHPDGAPEATYRYKVGYTPPTVLINEFLADNEHVNQDEAGEYDDWVELYNDSAFTVNVGGMYLTDDVGQPTKWQFPSGTSIAPGGHLLVWCDGDTGQGPLHANFRLNRDGEEIGLFDSEGHGLVSLDWVAFGQQQDDVSYGRRPDGADAWEFLDPPTPGMSNE